MNPVILLTSNLLISQCLFILNYLCLYLVFVVICFTCLDMISIVKPQQQLVLQRQTSTK